MNRDLIDVMVVAAAFGLLLAAVTWVTGVPWYFAIVISFGVGCAIGRIPNRKKRKKHN